MTDDTDNCESDNCEYCICDGYHTLSSEYESESLSELGCDNGSLIIEKSKIPRLNFSQKSLYLFSLKDEYIWEYKCHEELCEDDAAITDVGDDFLSEVLYIGWVDMVCYYRIESET